MGDFLKSWLLDHGLLLLAFIFSQVFGLWLVHFYYRKHEILLAFSSFLFCCGIFFNVLVVVTNNYKMPILLSSSEYTTSRHHTNLNSTTHFWYLGDVFKLPKPYNSFRFSLGDLLMSFGYVPILLWICHLLFINLIFLFKSIVIRRREHEKLSDGND